MKAKPLLQEQLMFPLTLGKLRLDWARRGRVAGVVSNDVNAAFHPMRDAVLYKERRNRRYPLRTFVVCVNFTLIRSTL